MNITEADRATARRVIRRWVGARENARIFFPWGVAYNEAPSATPHPSGTRVAVGPGWWDAACLAAARGRAYAKALRGAK